VHSLQTVVDLLHFCNNAAMDKLFGSASRTDTLVTIGRLQRTYASEIARVLSRRVIEIQRAVASLEQAGVIVSNRMGNTRIVELNPTLPAKDELYGLLLRMSEMPIYGNRWPKIRRRPRAMGKPS
jgi:DNA-binding transcriptional ArsR family regulator